MEGLVILLKNGFKSWNFSTNMTLKFDGWPKNKRAPLLYYIKLCAYLEMPNSGQNWRFVVPRDLENWRMTLENDKAPLRYYINLCASFQSHQWIQTGVTVRKHPIWVKIVNFLSRVTLKFDGWPKKTIRYLFYATWSFVYHFQATSQLKLE